MNNENQNYLKWCKNRHHDKKAMLEKIYKNEIYFFFHFDT
jgi:hypothetical protein